jgi:hypothetical protein
MRTDFGTDPGSLIVPSPWHFAKKGVGATHTAADASPHDSATTPTATSLAGFWA